MPQCPFDPDPVIALVKDSAAADVSSTPAKGVLLFVTWDNSPNFYRFPCEGDRIQHANLGRTFMQFRPLHDRVLVRRVEQEAKTTGGIIIPDTAQEKPMEGEVIAVGAGVRGEDGTVHPLDVKAGDRVLFGKWSGTEVKIDGEELMIMKESDVMGIVDSGAAAGNKS
jgi:chaperonin GroES